MNKHDNLLQNLVDFVKLMHFEKMKHVNNFDHFVIEFERFRGRGAQKDMLIDIEMSRNFVRLCEILFEFERAFYRC